MIYILYLFFLFLISFISLQFTSLEIAFISIALAPFTAFFMVFLLLAFHIPIFKLFNVKPHNSYLNYLNRQMITLFNHLFLRMKTTLIGSFDPTLNQVIYSNHTSYSDALCVLEKAHMPMAFTPKVSILKIPFISQWIKLLGSFPVDRNNSRKTLENMIKAIQIVKNGQNMLVFPEGTVKDKYLNDVENMKAGAFKLVLKAQTYLTLIKITGDIDIRKKVPFFLINRTVQIIGTYDYQSIKEIPTSELSKQMIQTINTFTGHKDQ